MRKLNIAFARKAAVLPILSIALLCSSACATPNTQEKFPPYPDVWEWHLESARSGPPLTELRRLPDGDVLVSFSSDDRDSTRGSAISFFARRAFKNVEAAFGGKYPPPDQKRRIVLGDGTIVVTTSGDYCSRGLGSGVHIRDDKDKTLRSVSLIFISALPMSHPSMTCEEETEPGWQSRVVILETLQLLPLADNTFLIVDSRTGVVVRMDSSLTIRQTVGKEGTFAFGTDELTRMAYKYWRAQSESGLDWVRFMKDLEQSLTNEQPKK